MKSTCRIVLGLVFFLSAVAQTPLIHAQSLDFIVQPSDSRPDERVSPSVQLRLTGVTGQPAVGIGVTLEIGANPGGGSLTPSPATLVTNADGVVVFDNLRIDMAGFGYTFGASADLPGYGTISTPSLPFAIAGASRAGPRNLHIYTVRIPPGGCPHPNPAITGCNNSGDTLPVGGGIYYAFGLLDTGSETVTINNSVSGATSDADLLNLCRPDGDCVTPAGQLYDPYLPTSLDVRVWGLDAVDPVTTGAPLDTPEAEIQSIHVGTHDKVNGTYIPWAGPTLIGAPVAARVLAEIDFRKSVSRTYSFLSEPLVSTDIEFFDQGDSGIPSFPVYIELGRIGSFGTSSETDASTGPRFLVKNARFTNGGSEITDTGRNFLFDTGNTTTQITEAMAGILGLDLANPIDTYQVQTPTGTETVKGFFIDSMEITLGGGTRTYTIEQPLIYVRSSLGGADANIGTNYFADARVLWDGPGDKLWIPRGIDILAPAADPLGAFGGLENQGGRRILARISHELPGLGIKPGDFLFTVGGDAATVVTETDVGAEHWVVLTAPPKSAGCHDLSVTHARDTAVTDTTVQSVCYEAADHALDRALAIDRTHSMDHDGSTNSWSGEKMEAARSAARFFVDLSSDADSIGVTSFKRSQDDGDGIVEQHELARTDFAMTPAQQGSTDNRPAARQAVSGVHPDGQGFGQETSIGAGLTQAWDILNNQGVADHQWEIVLLTDGRENYAPYWDRAGQSGNLKPPLAAANPPVRVHAVAIGGDANVTVLQDIAQTTSGLFWNLQEGAASHRLESRLANVYKAIDENMRNEQRFFYRERLPKRDPEGDDRIGTIPVEPGLDSMSVGFHWNKAGALSVELIDPDGALVKHSPPRASIHSDPKHQTFRINDPKAGIWRYRVREIQPIDLEFFAVASGGSKLAMLLGPLEVSRVETGSFGIHLTALVAGGGVATNTTVNGTVLGPDRVRVPIEFRDDGLSGDGRQGDGLYGTIFVTDLRGAHLVELVAEGATVENGPFTRMVSFSFVVPELDADRPGLPEPEPPPSVQPPPRKLSFGFHVGSSHPLGTLDDGADANVHAAIDVGYRISTRFGLRLFAGLNQFTAEASTGLDHPRYLNLSANLQIIFPSSPNLSWYLQGGPGVYDPKTGSTEAGFNLGGGARLPVNPRFDLEFGADYHAVGGEDQRFFTIHIGAVIH